MAGRVHVLALLVAIAAQALGQQDWGQIYGNRWNISLGNSRPQPRPIHPKDNSRRRGDMSPQTASWAVQPVEVDTSDIDFAADRNHHGQGFQNDQARTTRMPKFGKRPAAGGRGNHLPLPLPIQRDGPVTTKNIGSKMTTEERKSIFTRYQTILQLAEGLQKDLVEAKRHPICGADSSATALQSLQSGIGVVQATLEILIRIIQDSITEVSVTTNAYQNLEVCYQLLISIKVTTENVMSQLVQNDQAGALTNIYCTHPFQSVGGQCFYIHTTSTTTWFHARTQCKRMGGDLGGDLAVPHNLHLLQSYILQQRPDGRSLEYWLGGSDLTNENEWDWVTGARMDMNKGWNPGEPNSDRGGEDCVMLLDKDYPPLNDARCEKDRLHYICEVPPSDKNTQNDPPGSEPDYTSAPEGPDKYTKCVDEVDDGYSGPSCFYVSPSTEYVPWFKAREACKEWGGSIAQSFTKELAQYIMGRCGEKRWFWMGPSELDNIPEGSEQQVNLLMKNCGVFDAGQNGTPELKKAACEGNWHYVCQLPC